MLSREQIEAAEDAAAWAKALARLYGEIARDGRPSLEWAIRFASDGDVDAAIRRAWDACDDAPILRGVHHQRTGSYLFGSICARCRPPGREPWPRAGCRECLAIVRGMTRCPTLAELTRGPGMSPAT